MQLGRQTLRSLHPRSARASCGSSTEKSLLRAGQSTATATQQISGTLQHERSPVVWSSKVIAGHACKGCGPAASKSQTSIAPCATCMLHQKVAPAVSPPCWARHMANAHHAGCPLRWNSGHAAATQLLLLPSAAVAMRSCCYMAGHAFMHLFMARGLDAHHATNQLTD